MTHYDDGNRIHDNVMAMPWEIYNCPNTSTNFTLGVENSHHGAVEYSDGSVFIGISLDAYALIGGHLKIGFNW